MRKRATDDPARVENANRHLVGAMLAEADAATEPMLILVLYSEAATQARDLGLFDLEKVAVEKLQAAPAPNWQSIKFEINLPPALFDAYLPGFKDATDWREALGIWLHPTDAPQAATRTIKAPHR